MPRPFDWHLVGLAGDPTPGDAFGIRSLAREYGRIAEAAADAEDIVRRARRSRGASSWVGLAGEVFREKSEGLPGELASAAESYAAAERALRDWADRLDDAQAQADRGLQQAREAHGELAAARAAIGSANWSLTAAQAQVLQYETLERLEATIGLPPGVSAPTPYQVRSADRAVQQAQQSLRSAQAAEQAAQSRLDAARALVLEAKSARDAAESTTVKAIAAAGDSAVKPSSIWEAITSSQAWQVIVTIATVVVTVVGIVAIFIGGPIVWALIAAASVLLIVNALMNMAQGKDVTLELIFLAVGLIPGGRGLTSVAGIANAFRSGTNVVSGLGHVAVHLGSSIKIAIAQLIRSLQHARHGLLPGLRSMIVSIPSAFAGAASTAARNPIQFIRSAVNAMHHDFSVGFNSGWANHVNQVGRTDPAVAAALTQGEGAYFKIDDWTTTTPAPGHMWQAGHGGAASGFVMPAGTHTTVEGTWQGLQVAAHDRFGYRDGLVLIEQVTPFPVATGHALANTHLGAGGMPQGFIPDVAVHFQNGDLVARAPSGAALPVDIAPMTNSRGDVLGHTATVIASPGQVIHLLPDPTAPVMPTVGQVQSMLPHPIALVRVPVAPYNVGVVPDRLGSDDG